VREGSFIVGANWMAHGESGNQHDNVLMAIGVPMVTLGLALFLSHPGHGRRLAWGKCRRLAKLKLLPGGLLLSYVTSAIVIGLIWSHVYALSQVEERALHSTLTARNR
jgi:hypothetical protein